jgi:hypothetical protein
MSKLANKAKSSRLKDPSQPVQIKAVKEKVVRQVKPKEFPRSYRLDAEVMNALQNTLDRVNEASPRKVSEARLVKALIMFSREISEEKLMKSLKEVW